ncbi:MAG: hypothetical protein FD173_421 [Gallionellaceae bacterium]|nr:MAG: hypothetical protein FD173_421 [Gallionellaceae bacterium]
MPKPQDVNPGNFSVERVIYNNGEFSIAYGVWEKTQKVIAMRWNGDDKDMGYPKTFGNPMWFIVHSDLKPMILKGLIDMNPEFLLSTTDSID